MQAGHHPYPTPPCAHTISPNRDMQESGRDAIMISRLSTCLHLSQNHSFSGILFSGGRKQYVWYSPLLEATKYNIEEGIEQINPGQYRVQNSYQTSHNKRLPWSLSRPQILHPVPISLSCCSMRLLEALDDFRDFFLVGASPSNTSTSPEFTQGIVSLGFRPLLGRLPLELPSLLAMIRVLKNTSSPPRSAKSPNMIVKEMS